jgi:hypothetical protein
MPDQEYNMPKIITLLSWPARLFVVAAFVVCPCSLAAQELRPARPPACEAADDRVEVLLVGSYHMRNPGRDGFNLEADDVRTPRRQAEIATLTEQLAAFRPTKVAVEKRWQDSTTLARYNAYRRGEHELNRDETEQIGFRLAKEMGHETIYPIDVVMTLNDEALGPLIAANPAFQEKMQGVEEFGSGMMQLMGEWLAKGTIGEMLYNMNRPEYIRLAHDPYVEYFVPIAEGDNYAGADMVATWYQRNLRIFANLTRITDSPDDRIFVIYGSGHVPPLHDLVVAHPGYCVVDPMPYLR